MNCAIFTRSGELHPMLFAALKEPREQSGLQLRWCWICVWWDAVIYSQVKCHRVFTVSPKAALEADRETNCEKKPSTGLAIWGEKSTHNNCYRISILEKVSPRPQMTPFPGFLGE